MARASRKKLDDHAQEIADERTLVHLMRRIEQRRTDLTQAGARFETFLKGRFKLRGLYEEFLQVGGIDSIALVNDRLAAPLT